MRRPHLLACALVLVCLLPPGPQARALPPEAAAPPDLPIDPRAGNLDTWWTTVQEQIRKAEYHITWQEQVYLPGIPPAWQAPNRAHNLRTYFTTQGPAILPRVSPGGPRGPDGPSGPEGRKGAEGADAVPWHWLASLTAWGREDALAAIPAAVLHAEQNHFEYRRAGLIEWYHNDEEGLQQGFTLLAPPAADQAAESREQPLRLELRLGGDLAPALDDARQEVEYRTDAGKTMLRASPPHATDAENRPLTTWISLQDKALSLHVDDAGASYPIQISLTLDGLPSGHDWVSSGGGPTGQFGFSVATAGDVNGDGFSDVIVGAPYYDGGQTDEGWAGVYPGWRLGLENIPLWVKESGQAGAEYGYSVATAGDVNGDGYADIIVGAPKYDDGQEDEGGAWIYHGTRSGPHSAPDNFDAANQAYAGLGTSVATAGDVNGDTYADVIVGAPCFSNGEGCEGRVWVWHGSRSGISTSHNWRAESNQATAGLGKCVATAGDVNGDGYADIIVGAPYYNAPTPNEGAALVWYGSADGVNNDLNGDPTNAWMVESNRHSANLGFSVGTAGDVNGDDYADVIIGAPFYSNGHEEEGAVWVFHGAEAGLETTSANKDEANQADSWLGYSVATAGDVNGDGYADILVGAPLWNQGYFDNGAAFVWYGHAGGVSPVRDWMAVGERGEAWFGTSVATAGDVNGDGYSDILIGAPGDLSKWGSAYAYYGSASSLQQEAGWTKASSRAYALFGFSVGTAGDVNADGYADVIVGAPRWDGGQVAEGGAWVYHGKEGGLNTAPAWDKFSDKALAQFGWSVGTAGDVNGDGFSDVIVGAPTWTEGQEDEGMAFVYRGGSTGLLSAPNWAAEGGNEGTQYGYSVGAAGDVNGDGFGDIIVGVPFFNEAGAAVVHLGSEEGVERLFDWHDTFHQANAQFGASVGTAGDVNGDGYSDIIIGAPLWDHGDNNEGGAFVYHGSNSGLRAEPVWQKEGGMFDAQLGYAVGTAGDTDGDGFSDVIIGAPSASHGSTNEGIAFVYGGSRTGLDASPLWRKESGQMGAFFGWSVGTAGDVNGDGYADIIVGAHLWSGGQSYEGGAWVYHGSGSGPHSAPDWHGEGNQASAHFGHSAGTAGDVNGDGYADVIVGAPNYNRVLTDEGQAFVYLGNGGSGASLALLQLDTGESWAPIAPLGHANKNSFRLRTYFSMPLGRGFQHFEIEAKPLGRRFDGSDTFVPGGADAWSNPSPGAATTMGTGKLRPETAYHWRMRTLYHPGTTPFLPAGRWVTIPWNGWNEQDLRTGGGLVYLPLVTRDDRY